MLFKNVSIHTVAHLEAPIRVTSAEMSARIAKTLKRIRLPQNFLEKMTGIKERRFWEANQLPSEVATLVANAVIKKSGLSKNDIGAVISTSVTKDFIEPSIAAIVHGNLDMPDGCMNFDLTNACLGFLNGIHVAASMIENGQMNHVLVVAGENVFDPVEATLQRLEQESATLEDVREQLATLTLGSGAVAMIISRSSLTPNGHTIRGLTTLAATQHNQLCRGWPDRMVTDAAGMLEAGLTIAFNTFQKAHLALGWHSTEFDEYAIHQVSKPLTTMLLKMLHIEPHKLMTTFPDYGNMGPVSLPFTISKLETAGRLIAGKRLAIIGAGSGLNGMVMEVQW
ncbi:MAG: 3-oxoacyl-ACP synthase III [Burkholderiaceae bacterium]|nr:3-oxoacyl-ACP synthase III [Burkholderiaceae bacterium]